MKSETLSDRFCLNFEFFLLRNKLVIFLPTKHQKNFSRKVSYFVLKSPIWTLCFMNLYISMRRRQNKTQGRVSCDSELSAPEFLTTRKDQPSIAQLLYNTLRWWTLIYYPQILISKLALFIYRRTQYFK